MRILIAALIVLMASAALAQYLRPPIGPGSSLPIGPISSVSGGGGGGGGGGCNGTIDLSSGCAMPMLGGVP